MKRLFFDAILLDYLPRQLFKIFNQNSLNII